MKLFLSWSGERSRAVAEALKAWIPNVIQAVEPWMSEDMPKGIRWSTEIADRLEESKIGIFCLTADNLTAEWLHFEAGAVSKATDSLVMTMLLDIKKSDVREPLGRFQHTAATDRGDMLKLMQTVNERLPKAGEKALTEVRLHKLFDTFWPELEPTLRDLASRSAAAVRPKRQVEDLLEEVLQTVRRQDARLETLLARTTLRNDFLAQYLSQQTDPLGLTDPSSLAALLATHSALRPLVTHTAGRLTVDKKEEPPADDTTSGSTPPKTRTT